MNLLARKLAHLLAENANDSFYEDEIRYGLEIVLGALFQLLIIMFIAFLLGIAEEVIAIAIAAALYRRYSGGAHCQAYYRCTLTSLVAFILLGYASHYFPLIFWPYLMSLIVILSLIIIYHYVPVDNPGYRITEETIRRKRKQKSYVSVLLIIIASTLSRHFNGGEQVAIALLAGLLWQNFTLVPIGHNFTCLLDNIFSKMEKITRKKA